MANIRQPSVAGYFYPKEEHTLKQSLQDLLSQAKKLDIPPPKAIIAPHAGYIYSGPVAATIYKTLLASSDTIQRVVLLGPAHRYAFHGIAATQFDSFVTPLGTINVDLKAIESVLKLPSIKVVEQAYDAEHCLEVQLPFLQTILKNFMIVPFIVGNADPEHVANLILHLWGGPETLILVSSDLSHYYDYNTAQKLDIAATKAITELAPNDLHDNQACGRLPIKGLLLAADKLKLQVQNLDLRNSGDTAGDKERVVGYGAYHFIERS